MRAISLLSISIYKKKVVIANLDNNWGKWVKKIAKKIL